MSLTVYYVCSYSESMLYIGALDLAVRKNTATKRPYHKGSLLGGQTPSATSAVPKRRHRALQVQEPSGSSCLLALAGTSARDGSGMPGPNDE